MRCEVEPQSELFSYLSPEKRALAKHRLRSVKTQVDSTLKEIPPLLDDLYSEIRRPPIPPVRLPKAQRLIALYSVRSDRAFCRTPDYHILYRWFLDIGLKKPSFDASSYPKNRERSATHEVAERFFNTVVREARHLKLLSDENLSVDGTFIIVCASMKSFRRLGSTGSPPSRGCRAGLSLCAAHEPNAREHNRPRSTAFSQGGGSGIEALLCRPRPDGQSPRHGLISDVVLSQLVGTIEPEKAVKMQYGSVAITSSCRASGQTRATTVSGSSPNCARELSGLVSPPPRDVYSRSSTAAH